MIDLPAECTIMSWPPSGQGGQHVGTSSGVKIEHPPTGLTVIVNNGRSQYTNRQIAADMMLAGLTNPKLR